MPRAIVGAAIEITAEAAAATAATPRPLPWPSPEPHAPHEEVYLALVYENAAPNGTASK